MKSGAYEAYRLIGNQLLVEGDRHVWSDRLSLSSARPAGHAGGASPSRPLGAQGLPPKGGHPTPEGAAHAHRSAFEQSTQRHCKVVRLAFDAASKLFRQGVGVRVSVTALTPFPAFKGTHIFPVGGEGIIERSPFGLRPPVGFSGAGAHALTRAPALSCCMGCRP